MRTPLETGRPAQHADAIIVALAVDICAGFDQQPDRLQIAMHGREVERRGVVRKVAAVEPGAALDQKTDGVMLIAQCGQMQCRGLLKAAAAKRIDQPGFASRRSRNAATSPDCAAPTMAWITSCSAFERVLPP